MIAMRDITDGRQGTYGRQMGATNQQLGKAGPQPLSAGPQRPVRPKITSSRREWWAVIRRELLDIGVWQFRIAWLQEWRGRMSAAEARYRRILGKRPNQPHTLGSLGFLLLRARRFDEAIPVWEQAVAVDPQSVNLNFQLARALHRSGQVRQAAAQYLRVLALDPLHDKSIDALGQLGRRLARLGLELPTADGAIGAQAGTEAMANGICAAASLLISRAPDVALHQFKMALSLVPELPEALHGIDECRRQLQGRAQRRHAPTGGDHDTQRARAAYNEGRFDDAEAACRQLLAAKELDPTALSILSRLCMRASRWDEAIVLLSRLTAVQPGSPGPKEMLASALLLGGKAAAAARTYEALLDLQPQNTKLLDTLGRLHGRLGDHEAACRVFGRLVAIDESVVAARLAYGEALHRAGRDRDAEAQFDAALAIAPDHADALTLLGRLLSRNDPERALRLWRRLAERRPTAAEPPLQMARIHIKQKRYAEAQEAFREVLAVAPGHGEALRGVGLALAEINLQEAIEHFTKIVAQSPGDTASRLQLARHYLKARDWARAEAAYRDIAERDPQHREGLVQLALLLARNPERLDEAVALWERVADIDRTAYPLVQQAYLFERRGRVIEAEAAYRGALQRAAQDPMALVGLARLLAEQKRWEEAAIQFAALHKVDRRRPDALLGLGRCLERLDRTEEALATYKKVLHLDPINANALLYRGRLLRQLGRSEEAIETWRRVCLQTPQNADAWHELVFLLATADRDADALAALDEAEKALTSSPATWARLGLAAQAGQFYQRAINYLERAVAAEPHDASYHALLGQHYLRQGIADKAFRHLLASRETEPSDVKVAKQVVDTIHTLNLLGIDHVALAGRTDGEEVLVPERLFRIVREIAETSVQPYEPVPRRIVAVTASLAGGGAERQLVTMLRGLSDQQLGLDLALFCISLARRTKRDFFLPMLSGLPVEIVTPDDSAAESYFRQPAVLPYVRLVRAFPPEMATAIAFWLAEFRHRRPEVVHAWQDSTCLTAVVAALLAGVPRIVLAARSVRPDNPRRRLKRFMREGYRAVLGHSAVFLTNNSRAGANDYAEWLEIDPSDVEVVYNGIDFERMADSVDPIHVDQLRHTLGVPQEAPLVGSAFRMSEEKRPLMWVEVAAEVARQAPEAHFVVFGDGPMRSAMSDLATRLGIGDRLHLPGPDDNIASCYKAMDVVLLTSRHEGLPNVLLEAQSLGVPVVAPDVGGVSETILPGITGWAVPDATAASLAERVLHCLIDAAWTARAQQEAPSFVRDRFGVASMLRRTLDIYGMSDVLDYSDRSASPIVTGTPAC